MINTMENQTTTNTRVLLSVIAVECDTNLGLVDVSLVSHVVCEDDLPRWCSCRLSKHAATKRKKERKKKRRSH